MFLPGSTPSQTSLPIGSSISAMNHNLQQHHHHQQQQQQFLFDHLKDHRSSKFSPSPNMSRKPPPNFSLDPDLLRELNARYLHDINANRPTNVNPDGGALLLPPFLRAEHYHQHTHTHEHNLNIFTPPNNALIEKLAKPENNLSSFLRTNANFSPASLLPPPPPPLFSSLNPTAAATTSTTIKESSSPPAKKSNKWCAAHVRISWLIYHQQQRSKGKSSPADSKKDDEQKLPDLISTMKQVQPTISASTSDLSLPLPSTYPVPPSFNFRSPFEFAGGPFGRVVPSSSTAFGGLGSLFPSPSLIDRKGDPNGSTAANLGLDWSRFHRSLVPDNGTVKKLEEMTANHNDKKRPSTTQLMLPPSHLTNSNRSRSRSPHRSHHPYPLSMNAQNKSSSPPLPRKRTSPTVKSNPMENNHKPSPHFPPAFAGLDPLTVSMIERQRLSAAYASIFGVPPGSGNMPGNFLPQNLFAHLDASSAMSAALMQREHFLNSLRTSHQEQVLSPKKPTEESSRISPKVATSPGSHSSTSSSSSSKKSSHVKRLKSSSSPTLSTEHQESTGKSESISITS